MDLEVSEIMDMYCRLNKSSTELVTKQQVKEAINSLNRGKVEDVYGLTAEHFLYGGKGLVETTTAIINGLFKFGRLSDVLNSSVQEEGLRGGSQELQIDNNSPNHHQGARSCIAKENTTPDSGKPK